MNEPGDSSASANRQRVPADRTNVDSTVIGPKPSDSRSLPDELMESVTGALSAASTEQSFPTDPQSGDGSASVLPKVSGYRVLHEIARGGMGKVLAAYDLTLDREVALKTLLPGSNGDRFLRESRITARLPHPGIPPVYALGTLEDGSPFLAMKLIAGQTLAEQMKSDDRPRLLQVFTQVCQAVGFAHSRHVIHRDLKPANIMIGAFGEVQVMDWGLARDMSNRDRAGESGSPTTKAVEFVGSESSESTVPFSQGESHDDRTQAGDVLGTPAYMAPEQARGEPIDARADVFALGGILCAILTGRPPFVGKSALEVIRQAMAADLTDANARLEACQADSELVSLCQRCLSPAASDRLADGQSVADGMTSYLTGVQERLQATEQQRAVDLARAEEEARTQQAIDEKAAEQRKRRKTQRLLLGSVLGLVTAVGFGIALASLWQRAERAKETAVSAQSEAETSRTVAEKAQVNEAEARKAVEREREKLAVVEYGRTIQVAYENWRDNNLSAARALLESTRSKPHGWEWDYVDRLCHTELLTVPVASGGLMSAAFSADGSRIMTVSFDRIAATLDTKTGASLLTLNLDGHTNVLNSASFSGNESRIVTGSYDQTAIVWDAEIGNQMHVLRGHADEVKSAQFNANGSRIVTGSSDKTAKVWDVSTGAELLTLTGHTDIVMSASFNSDGSRIITGSGDRSAKVWDANSGTELLTLRGHMGPLNSATFSADGSRIVTSSDDRTSKVWDANSGTELLTLLGHIQEVRTASFNPDGSQIVTGSDDRTARVWDAATGSEVLALKGHVGPITSASFNGDGSQIVTGSGDGTVKVWDAKRTIAEMTLTGHTNVVNSASLSADGMRLVTGSADGTARVWDAKSGTTLLTFEGHSHQVQSALFNTDGTRVVTSGYDNATKVWDAMTGVELLSLGEHSGPVYAAAYSADGARIVTCSVDQTARIWDSTTGAELRCLRHKGPLTTANFNPDGSKIVTGGEEQTVRIWDAATGDVKAVLRGHTETVTSASFSADGLRIVSGSSDQTARIWDAATGDLNTVLRGHTAAVTSASFSADGLRVVTGSMDLTAKIWDAETGAELLSLRHNGPVFSASFSTDGSQLVTAMLAEVSLWDSRPFPDRRPPEQTLPQSLDSRFWALLRGEDQPADNRERLGFAEISYDHRQYAMATQLFSDALATDVNLGDDRELQVRYNAACVATLTAAEQGYDEPPVSEADKLKHRLQALEWLKAELSSWSEILESAPPDIRMQIAEILKYWQTDTDLASIRDPAALARLPANEQEAFTKLWADVEALLRKLPTTQPPPEKQ
jgi:WD40 repeat protein/serine/threonine protein kinase